MRSKINECLRTTLAFTTLVSYTPNIKYSKHNRVRFKSWIERDKGRKMFTEFFGSIRKEELGKEMRGHIILDSTSDIRESIILTFWETREDVDKFYSLQNKALASLVKRASPYLKKCLKELIMLCQNYHYNILTLVKN
jgi:heme-degrading monooxygenase HmoA